MTDRTGRLVSFARTTMMKETASDGEMWLLSAQHTSRRGQPQYSAAQLQTKLRRVKLFSANGSLLARCAEDPWSFINLFDPNKALVRDTLQVDGSAVCRSIKLNTPEVEKEGKTGSGEALIPHSRTDDS